MRIVVGRGQEHYFCKLVQIGASAPTLTVFIHGGQAAEFDVPLGSYELRYAVGATWYGEEQLFGPSDTSYHKAEDVLHFRHYLDRVSGYTVQLHRQINGNLETHKIFASEF